MDENKFAQFRDPADNPANRLGPGLPAPHFVGPVSPLEQPAMSPQNHSSNLADIAAGSHCPVCNQIYYSARCQYFYLALILANVVMIIWTLLMYQDIRENSLLHTFEIMLNCVMVVDIVLRMLIIGYGRTGSKLSAILDVITLLVCVLAIGLSALCQGSVSRLEELGDKILIVVICAAQYLRILNFFKMHRQRMAEESHKINIRADAGPEHRSIIIVDNIKGIDGSPATAAHNNKV